VWGFSAIPAYAIQPIFQHLAVFVPALSVSLVRQGFARYWAASIAQLCYQTCKKKKYDQHGHKLEKPKIILYANNSSGQNT